MVVVVVVVVLLLVGIGFVALVSRYNAENEAATPKPMPAAELTIEADKQTIVAKSADGTELWRRHIVADYGIQPRWPPDKPVTISQLKKPPEWYVRRLAERGHNATYRTISFNGTKSQGVIDTATGEFIDMGSD
jgi:hypothetical protein